MRRLVIDSSVSLKWWLDDEEHVAQAREILNQIYVGRITPVVPDLWHYEVANGIRTAILRRRINRRQGKTFISELLSMGFESHGINPYLPKVFDYAIKYEYAIYDFSYIVLAEAQSIDFVTGDERLLSTVREDLGFVYHLSTLSL